MLVDDDKFMHKVFDRIVSLAGHEVVEHAYNGQEALEKLAFLDQKPDIILMDHRMPIKNGVDTTREIINIYPDLRIMFVSADETVRDEALDAGAIGFLSKPIRSKQLLEIIDETFGIVSIISR
jgi:CheY-like chemotaxis protein